MPASTAAALMMFCDHRVRLKPRTYWCVEESPYRSCVEPAARLGNRPKNLGFVHSAIQNLDASEYNFFDCLKGPSDKERRLHTDFACNRKGNLIILVMVEIELVLFK
jgi:hypothetical protein